MRRNWGYDEQSKINMSSKGTMSWFEVIIKPEEEGTIS
jgi:hypothetical protein